MHGGRSHGGHCDPFDCREPCGRATVVKSRLNALRYDRDDLPAVISTECPSQVLLADGVGNVLGCRVAEAQQVQHSAGFGDGSEAGRIAWLLAGVEGMEQSTVEHRRKQAMQLIQLKRIRQRKLGADPALCGLSARDRTISF